MQLNVKKLENIVIAVLWIVVFAWPICYEYYQSMTDGATFELRRLFGIYPVLALFLSLFLLHHYVVLPRIFNRKHYWVYSLSVLVMLTGFCLGLRCFSPMLGFKAAHNHPHHVGPKPPVDSLVFPGDRARFAPEGPRHKPMDWDNRRRGHAWFLSPPDWARLLLAMLLLAVDLGGCVVIRSRQQRRRLQELEEQNLRQELQYLKHQLNPHFFMNTLNNIHVLIDLDQEKAKRSIIQLSQLMRYLLYESAGSNVPLSREVEFISQYISLMILRYSNKVEISCQLPEYTGHLQIPPLLLITFIENAFKHGISYQHPSFVSISLTIDEDRHCIRFVCCNSRHKAHDAEYIGGIGLENVYKRLNLLYPQNNYHLEVDTQHPEQYRVCLELPI